MPKQRTSDSQADSQAQNVDGFGLNEVLAALGRDLKSARETTAQSNGAFGLALKEAEVELALTVTEDHNVEGDGKLRFMILPWLGLDAGGEASVAKGDARVHRIKLTLSPTSVTTVAQAIAIDPETKRTVAQPSVVTYAPMPEIEHLIGDLVQTEVQHVVAETNISPTGAATRSTPTRAKAPARKTTARKTTAGRVPKSK